MTLTNVIAFNAAISACDKGLQWERALGLLSELERRVLQPDFVSLSSSVSSCEKGWQWELTIALLEVMQSSTTETDGIFVSAALGACGKVGALKQVMKFVSDVQRVGRILDRITRMYFCQTLEWGYRLGMVQRLS